MHSIRQWESVGTLPTWETPPTPSQPREFALDSDCWRSQSDILDSCRGVCWRHPAGTFEGLSIFLKDFGHRPSQWLNYVAWEREMVSPTLKVWSAPLPPPVVLFGLPSPAGCRNPGERGRTGISGPSCCV